MSDKKMGADALGLLTSLLENSPFHEFIAIEVSSVEPELGVLELKLPYRDVYQRTPQSGRYHGGVIASLIDIAGAFSVICHTGKNVPTTSLSLEYIRPPINEDLFAYARVRHAGRSIGIADVEVKTASDKLVALGRVSLSMRS